MEIQTGKFALAGAVTTGVLYVVCSLIVLLVPDLALKLAGNLMHLVNFEQFLSTVQITWQTFVSGLVQVFVYTYLTLLLFGWIYNKMTE